MPISAKSGRDGESKVRPLTIENAEIQLGLIAARPGSDQKPSSDRNTIDAVFILIRQFP